MGIAVLNLCVLLYEFQLFESMWTQKCLLKPTIVHNFCCNLMGANPTLTTASLELR
jgi:hypothetical protein